MSIGTATLLEMFWTLTGLVGLLINLWALDDAIADLRWQDALPVPQHDAELRASRARVRIARGNVRDEALRAAIQLVFMLVGIVAMASAPVDPVRPAPPLQWIVTGAIVAAQVMLVTKSIEARRDRQWIIATLTRHEWTDDRDESEGD